MRFGRFAVGVSILLLAIGAVSCRDIDLTNDDFNGTWRGTLTAQGENRACAYDAGDGKAPEMLARYTIGVHQKINEYLDKGYTVTVIDAKAREYHGNFASHSQVIAKFVDPARNGFGFIWLDYTLTDSSTAVVEQTYEVLGECKTTYKGVLRKESP